jgi:molecular chaperone DnaK
MSYHLGVDLGTTYTAAALARDGRAEPATLDTRSVAVPSVIYLAGNELLVGQAAARRSVSEPSRVAREFKRRVGDPTPVMLAGTPIPAEILMARLLDWVVRQVATTEGAPPERLAVTHPANWGEYKLDLLRQAIRHVGLHADHLVPEPVAAASFYAAQRGLAPGTTVAVYDLGGGTFDAAVVRVEDHGFRIVGRPDGIERLGGIDFDQAVFHHVTRSVGLDPDELDREDPAGLAALAQLREDCVEAKEALSAETDVSIPLLVPGHQSEVRLTRAEFEATIRPALDETLVALRRAIASAAVPVEDVHAVLLVGGSSRIPLVAQLVTAELGRPVAVDARPKDAIPLGASLVAWREAQAAAPQATAPPPSMAPPSAPQPPPTAVPSGAPSPEPRSSRAWLVAAVSAIVAVAAIAALLLTTDNGDGQQEAGGTTAPPTTSEPTEDEDDTTNTTSDPLEVLGGLGEGGTFTGSGEPGEELPGNDWNPAARTSFVEQCRPDMEAAASMTGGDPSELCGCIYDGMEESPVSFEEFNEAWTATDLDTSSPVATAIQTAVTQCSLG